MAITMLRAVIVATAGLPLLLAAGPATAQLSAVLPAQAPAQQSTPPAGPAPENRSTPQQSQQPAAPPPSRCQPRERPVS